MTASGIDPIVEGDARIRMLDRTDLPTTLAWRNHPDSRRWFLTTDLIEPSAHERWFEGYRQRDDDYVFIVEVGGVPRAQVALSSIHDGEAEFGRLLVDPEHRGHGVAHLATGLCLRVAREALGLRALTLEVRADNAAAIRAYVRAGFQEVERTPQGIVAMRAELT
jgi:RimJ/RimL family protein N-acetyltransferase